MKTRSLTFPFFLFLLLLGPPGFVQAQESKKPNILIVLADDLGYGDLSAYGATDLQTPHIDALIADGVRCDEFYASCPVCSPTRASLLTGSYPGRVGVPGVIRTYPRDNWGYLAPDATLLPTLLKPLGYHTAIIGKWHLGLEPPNRPSDRGFDHFHGFLGDMMDDYYKHLRHGQHYMRLNTGKIDPVGHATDLFSDWSVDYLEKRKDAGEPFFLYLAYNAPHTPIQPPIDWLEKVKAREKGRGNSITDRRAKLVALIEHMDDGIGKVIAALKANKQYDNTLIIFTSDNGGQTSAGANNGGLRDGKQSMYEGGLKVPFAAVWKNRIKPGSKTALQGITMDLFPTAIEAAGGKAPEGIDGRSLLTELQGRPVSVPERDLFWERREGNRRYMGECIWAMRRGPWKLLKNSPYEPWELYNLAEDPKEKANRFARNPPKILNSMLEAMRLHMQRGGSVPWQPLE